jgi:SAM-dependent methyltransferase
MAAGGRSTAPLPLGWAVRRVRELTDFVVLLGSRPPVPVPPRRLRARTGAPGVREFLEGGRQAARELGDVLETLGRPFSEFESVLDLGAGSARVLPHVAELATGARCTGCDVDAAAIEWATRHHPQLELAISHSEPPLPFADGSFDLVYSISVFSHLDEPAQDRWLGEVRRVLRPGGVALLSVHGGYAFEQFRTGRAVTGWCRRDAFARGPLRAEEFVFEPYVRTVWNERELPGVGEEYGLAFHGERYIRDHWSRWLTVERVAERALTGWQDVVAGVQT